MDEALERRDRTKAAYDEAVEHLYEVLRNVMRAPANRHGVKAELAKRTGYSRQHLLRIEQGESWRTKKETP